MAITLTNLHNGTSANGGGTLVLYGVPDLRVTWSHSTGAAPNDRNIEVKGEAPDPSNPSQYLEFIINSTTVPETGQSLDFDNIY